ncbi:phosphotransferase family protein [Aquibacillus salsiterrae]|uniref:Phosphotransferase family protein n=1 Tax=Aquibacillus salsiterrae TaxID=2950439 RepID=A0A9X3WCG2_9BACI|nr:phosphotransferase family protein [Aquibacillus salsiterrae]MDC3415806.1 phosphotransferase family protein [Aquibacillus salsiterrae]
MEHILGNDWIITSAGGSTGEAYYAQGERKRLFLKRNSSPFIAVLSAQGIVPKLVWTKRLENGDVITAQEWLEGRELTSEEMRHPKVAMLLSKIHHSTELYDMFVRIDKDPIQPYQVYQNCINQLNELIKSIEVKKALDWIETMLPMVENNTIQQVVCHCDMNHNNWLLSEDGQLYLIDWDNAKIGDPAIDIGMILYNYIPENEWDQWLESYGINGDQELLNRMYWYLFIEMINKHEEVTKQHKYKEAAQFQQELQRLLSRVIGC